MGRDDAKLKSSRRKPLRDVSNGGVKWRKPMKPKSKEDEQVAELQDTCPIVEDPLDRLLLAHSDLSSLLRQIDELVVQAVKVKTNDDNRNKEIGYFANVMSEIYSSLKPSVLRLEKALAVCHSDPEIQLGETSSGVPTVVDEGEEHGADTPQPTKKDSLVSPSPLVSWRAADCTVERGKQLFLLTPLPRPKTTISKTCASSKATPFGGITLSNFFPDPALCAPASESNQNMSIPVAKNEEIISDLGASHMKISMGESTVLMTPCLKIPASSSTFLEPDCTGRSDKPRMSTPYPVGDKKSTESTDSESSGCEISEKLGLNYPELIGIKQSCMLGNGSKALEASPAWVMSPPKCCTLLEPLDEKPVKEVKEVTGNFNQQICLAPPKESSIQINDQDLEKKGFHNQGSCFVRVESTPLWKGCESTIHRGKRPGEYTLKKELWTKFEAASMGGSRLNFCAFDGTSQKGFLDRLEEASCDEATSHPNSLR